MESQGDIPFNAWGRPAQDQRQAIYGGKQQVCCGGAIWSKQSRLQEAQECPLQYPNQRYLKIIVCHGQSTYLEFCLSGSSGLPLKLSNAFKKHAATP